MSNLIPLEDAARMLGFSVDKLNELRSNSEIFGYKDGTSWKFKMQEIERVAQEFDITVNTTGAAADAVEEVVDLVDDEFEISLEDDDDDDDLDFDLSDSSEDLIQKDSAEEAIEIVTDDEPKVVEEQEVFDSSDDDGEIEVIDLDDNVKAVDDDDDDFDFSMGDDDDQDLEIEVADDDVIDLVGDDEVPEPVAKQPEEDDEDFDLAIADDDEFSIESEEDDFQLKSDSEPLDLATDEGVEEELSLGSSDINLAGSEDSQSPENTVDSAELNLDDDDLVLASGAADGDLLADEPDSLLLSEDDLFEDDLKIHESHEDDIDLSSDFEDSNDLIMEDSDSSAGSVVLGDEDSGFELDDDSAEIDLSGSLMDLAGVDGDDEMIVLDEPAAADAATEIADDDFNLTPLEEVVGEDSSGSQIIALEDSDMFGDSSAATLLSPSDEMEAEPMLTEDAMDVGDFGAFDTGVPGMAPGMAINPGAVGALPEQPYTLWQIVSLGLVLFLLLVGGMVGYDLARNLWLPDDQIISGGVLPMILNLVGG